MNEFKDKIVKELSLNHNIPKVIIEHIVNSEFKFVKHIIEKGDYHSVRLDYLGLFGVTPGRLYKIYGEYAKNNTIT